MLVFASNTMGIYNANGVETGKAWEKIATVNDERSQIQDVVLKSSISF